MKSTKRFLYRLSILAVAFSSLIGLGVLISGEEGSSGRMGIVDDWSHHRLIFSNPGTAVEALAQGRVAEWYKIVNDPRYIMQQRRRNPAPAASAQGFTTLASRLNETFAEMPPVSLRERRAPAPHRDWSYSLGTGTVAQGMYPAKYSFSITGTPDCTNDFVVYGLNVAGTTSGQANLVGLNNLYSASTGTNYCSGTGPKTHWAYNVTTKSGGTVSTSPALYWDGSKVIFVETSSSGSVLHVLRWVAGEGTGVGSAAAPDQTQTSYGACTGTTSCLVSIPLSSYTVTHSSPFYDYSHDVVYVGDDNGSLFKVTPVIGSGTPAVTAVSVSSGNFLTSPVYDGSTYVFVGGNYSLWAVTASNLSNVYQSPDLGTSDGCSGNNILYDGPIVDAANNWVYAWVTSASTYSYVFQLPTTGSSGPSGTWADAGVRVGQPQCGSSTTFPTWSPTFDNSYYNGTITNGHMWVCGRENSTSGNNGYTPELWYVPTAGTNGAFGSKSSGVALGTSYISATAYAQCSPMTEIYNGTTDYMFFGEGLSGSLGDLYGFTISGATATAISGSPLTTYGKATGGTSGIVIDNIVSSDTQAASIYFTTLVTSSLCGTSTYCAVKLTQSALQ
jgi:hypothetical protein